MLQEQDIQSIGFFLSRIKGEITRCIFKLSCWDEENKEQITAVKDLKEAIDEAENKEYKNLKETLRPTNEV